MKMCKWCQRVYEDNVTVCRKCRKSDLANVDLPPTYIGEIIKEWMGEKENA